MRYWITFRLFMDLDYDVRYAKLIRAIEEVAADSWEEPTSFLAIESSFSIDAIGAHLKAVLGQRDILVIREIDRNSVRYAGRPLSTFFTFFPDAKKL